MRKKWTKIYCCYVYFFLLMLVVTELLLVVIVVDLGLRVVFVHSHSTLFFSTTSDMVDAYK